MKTPPQRRTRRTKQEMAAVRAAKATRTVVPTKTATEIADDIEKHANELLSVAKTLRGS